MNQLVELPRTDGRLVTINPQTYVAAAYESFLARFEGAVKQYGEVTYNITTKTGMETAKTARAVFRDIRTGTEKKRAECKAPIIEIGKLLDSRAKEITAQIEPHESRFDADIKAEEKRLDDEKAAKIKAEAERQTALQANIDHIKNMPLKALSYSSSDIAGVIVILTGIIPNEENFAERFVEAEIAKNISLEQLNTMLENKKASEELARQQEAQRIENERIAREIAEAKAIEEERQRAAQKAEAERITAEREAIERERAELNKARQEIEALNAERARIQAEEEARAKAAAQKTIDEAAAKAKAEQDAKLKAIEEASKSLRLTPDETVDVMREMGVDEQTTAQPIPRPSDKAIIMAVATVFEVSEWKARCWIIDVAASMGE